ncbi:hypothetical protein BC835DRAFT_1530796 [Cytidiella melzeri]|nr:hypothetical protein BC835DRAFT_1530796 [Cytidiella melzeri]
MLHHEDDEQMQQSEFALLKQRLYMLRNRGAPASSQNFPQSHLDLRYSELFTRTTSGRVTKLTGGWKRGRQSRDQGWMVVRSARANNLETFLSIRPSICLSTRSACHARHVVVRSKKKTSFSYTVQKVSDPHHPLRLNGEIKGSHGPNSPPVEYSMSINHVLANSVSSHIRRGDTTHNYSRRTNYVKICVLEILPGCWGGAWETELAN